jgi:hypothetical protein
VHLSSHRQYPFPALVLTLVVASPEQGTQQLEERTWRDKDDPGDVHDSPIEAYDGRGALLSVGEEVEARFGGGANFYKGRITAAHPDGSYDVAYDDGDREVNVDPALIRTLEAPKVGDPVKA